MEGEDFDWDPGWVLGGSVGDNPQDYEALTMGEELWRTYGAQLNRSKIESRLRIYIDRFQLPNVNPGEDNPSQCNYPHWEANSYRAGEFDVGK